MKITVKTLKGEQFPLEVNPEDKILVIKEKLQELKGFEVAQQKLLHKGKMTYDDKSLEETGIKENDFLVVTVMIKKKPQAQAQPVQQSEPKPEQPSQPEQPKEEPPKQEEQKPVGGDGLVTGGKEEDDAVNTIISMGLGDGDKEKIRKALRAAYNNVERAIEYLLSGHIPEAPQQPQVPQPGQGGQGGQQQELGGDSGNQLAILAQNPQFQQIRQVIQQNPQMAPQILGSLMEQLQHSNPEIFQLIQQNSEQFLQLLLGGAGPGAQGGQPQAPPGTIQVTPEEKAAIDRIAAFGFERLDALEAYMCCGKNEELALNYLFDNKDQGGLMSDHIHREEEDQQNQQQQQQQQQQPQGDQGNNDNNNNQGGGNNNDNNNNGNNNNNNNNNNNGNNDDGNIFDD